MVAAPPMSIAHDTQQRGTTQCRDAAWTALFKLLWGLGAHMLYSHNKLTEIPAEVRVTWQHADSELHELVSYATRPDLKS